MKLKLLELRLAELSLKKIMDADLPIRISYRISRSIKPLLDEIEACEKKRNELVIKYGDKNKKNEITVKKENMEKFKAEIDDFLNEEIEIDYNPIKLVDIQDINLSAKEFIYLDKFVEYE